jgi:hypothetical protein
MASRSNVSAWRHYMSSYVSHAMTMDGDCIGESQLWLLHTSDPKHSQRAPIYPKIANSLCWVQQSGQLDVLVNKAMLHDFKMLFVIGFVTAGAYMRAWTMHLQGSKILHGEKLRWATTKRYCCSLHIEQAIYRRRKTQHTFATLSTIRLARGRILPIGLIQISSVSNQFCNITETIMRK